MMGEGEAVRGGVSRVGVFACRRRRRVGRPGVGVLLGPHEYAMTVTGVLVRVLSGCGGGVAAPEMPCAEILVQIPVPLTIDPLLT